MKKNVCVVAMSAVFALLFSMALPGAWARDFLTKQEITRLQNTQDIDRRTRIYMDAAALRLRAAQDRIEGKEPKPGDAMEFLNQEDMLDDYYKIMDRLILIIDDAFGSPRRRENINIKRALNTLKSESSGNLKRLLALMKLAEEKKKEDLRNRVGRAVYITGGILDGADEGLSQLAEREKEEERRRQELLRR
jgi:hypothetical protein